MRFEDGFQPSEHQQQTTQKQQQTMSKELRQTIQEYISGTRWATLATVRPDGAPVLRAMGSFALDGLDIVFSTPKATAKLPTSRRTTRSTSSFNTRVRNYPPSRTWQ